jgi:hypothetical protein
MPGFELGLRPKHSARAYAEHRERLVAATFPATVLVIVSVTLLYVFAVVSKGPEAFRDELTTNALQLLVPLVALLLARGVLRDRVEHVALGLDFAYTALLAYRLFLWLLPIGLVGAQLLGILVDLNEDSVEGAAKEFGIGAAAVATASNAVETNPTNRYLLLGIGIMLLLWFSLGLLFVFGLCVSPCYYIPMSVFSIEFGGPHSGFLIALLDALSFVATAIFYYRGGAIAEQSWSLFLTVLVAISIWSAVMTFFFMLGEARRQRLVSASR